MYGGMYIVLVDGKLAMNLFSLLVQGGKAAFARVYTAPLQACRASPGSLPRLARFGAPRQGWRTHFLTIFKNNHLEQKKGPKLKN